MKRLIVGITGASGVAYGVRMLEALREAHVESHLVVSKPAEVTLAHETEHKLAEVRGLADAVYGHGDVGAAIASGSFKTMGMIVAPCSIKTLSEIASGVTDNLVSRAADVVLKERRRLVLMVRETPLHVGHLRAMLTAAELGAIPIHDVNFAPVFYGAAGHKSKLGVEYTFLAGVALEHGIGEPVCEQPPVRTRIAVPLPELLRRAGGVV